MKFFAMIYSVLHSPPQMSCNSFSVSIFCVLSIFLTFAVLSIFPFYLFLLDPSLFLFCLCMHVSYTFVHPSIHSSYHPSIHIF